MLTWTPDNSLSAYSCNACGISAQVPVQATNPDTGALLVNEDYTPVLVNDEPAASAEINEHIAEVHPELISG